MCRPILSIPSGSLALVIWSALGPIHLSIGERILHALDPLRFAVVPVPRDGVRVFANIGSLELSDGTASKVVVMVDDPDFRLHASALE
jgi:hypothetical protein